MKLINRNYWDKNIPIRDEKCAYPESKRLGDKLYFGESLKNKLGKKAAIIIFKVIPVIALSILFAPVAIPLFAKFNVYRDTGRRIREVHYNRKFRFIDEYIKPKNQSKSASSFIEPSTILPREVLKLACQKEAENLYGQKALKYLKTLQSVCKEWKSISDEMRVELINSGNLTLNDLPEIKTKDEALAYIEAHKNQLQVLNLDFFDWNDADIKTILLACPHLEGLTVNFTDKLSTAVFDDIIQFKNLNHLSLKNGKAPLDYTALNALSKLKVLDLSNMGIKDSDIKSILNSQPNFEGLTLNQEKITDAALTDINQFQKLQHLELKNCPNLTDYSALDHFLDLQTLRIDHPGYISMIPPSLTNLPTLINLEMKCSKIQGDFPNLAHLAKLEKLKMCIWDSPVELSSLETLTYLKELHLQGRAFHQIPPLNSLVELKKLYIGSNDKLKDMPLLPAMLKELEVRWCPFLLPPDVKHLLNLEQLTFESCPMDFPPDYFDSLTQLKKLEFCDANGSFSKHDLPSLDALTNLQILRFKTGFNNSPSLLGLKNLKGLQIHQLPFLGAPQHLKLLIISSLNNIKPQLNQLTGLTTLIYNGFEFTNIEKDMFENLINLETVVIKNSLFTKLPDLNNQKKLKEIYLHHDDQQSKELAKKYVVKDQRDLKHDSLFEELLD